MGCPADPPPKGERGRGAAWRLNEDEVQAWLESKGLRLPGERKPHNPAGGRPDGDLAEAGAEVDPEDAKGFSQEWRREKLRKERALRRLNELKLERARGEVVPRAEHEAQVLAAIDAVRTVLLAAPRKYAAHLVGLDEAEARALLGRIVSELLDLFAGKLR